MLIAAFFGYETLHSKSTTSIRLLVSGQIRPEIPHGQSQLCLEQSCCSHQRSGSGYKTTGSIFSHRCLYRLFLQEDLAHFDILYLTIKQDTEHHKKAKNTNEVDRKLERLLERYGLEKTIQAFQMVRFFII